MVATLNSSPRVAATWVATALRGVRTRTTQSPALRLLPGHIAIPISTSFGRERFSHGGYLSRTCLQVIGPQTWVCCTFR